MSDLFWPGDQRAGEHGTDSAFVQALVSVELAWLEVLGFPAPKVGAIEPMQLTDQGGTPVLGLVTLLRERLAGHNDPAARWVHRGLTSQDVVDSALMLMARAAVAALRACLREQVESLVGLAVAHRHTPIVARTLTQPAIPSTFGLKVATWLDGVLDAGDDLARLAFPVQLGGAAGTNAALVEMGRNPAMARATLADRLGLADSRPWHTSRRPVTRIGDALVACTDAWARVANDVLVLGRPEIGEVSGGSGGRSSTMPHKENPVLSVLVRRAALTTPQLAATLHLAAADQVDERPPGGWHAEWDTLRLLLRRSLVAGVQTAELMASLRIHQDRMDANLTAAVGVLSEQQSLAALVGAPPHDQYLGEAGGLIDAVVARARASLDVRR